MLTSFTAFCNIVHFQNSGMFYLHEIFYSKVYCYFEVDKTLQVSFRNLFWSVQKVS